MRRFSSPEVRSRNAVSLSATKWGRGLGWARYQDMGNTLMSAHRLHFRFLRCENATLIDGWPHRCGIVIMQMTNTTRPEINRLHSFLEWLESDTLPDEGFSDKSFSALPLYFA